MTYEVSPGFWTDTIAKTDVELYASLQSELKRQQDFVELIASENITSWAVMQTMGSVHTNKYAEGYPGRRYYGGCAYVDKAEELANERLRKLFSCSYANSQPHSGAQANQAVFLALLKPGDTFMGLDLAHGGHLTHGAVPNQSGKWFNAVSYGVREQDQLIDMDKVRDTAKSCMPKLIIAGGSAYPRQIDFKAFREICDEVGAYFMVDMAHFAGLVAGGVHPNPLDYAHVVTSTTHKTLRGPRGGIILSNDLDLGKKFNSAVFPGLQGGPLMHVIAAKAVAFGEALGDDYKTYCQQIVKNAHALGEALVEGGLSLVSGGTDTHLLLVDLRPKGVKGNAAEKSMDRAHMTCNKNAVPFDTEKPMVTSGVRLGTPAGTTRGFGEEEFRLIGRSIVKVVDGLAANGIEGNAAIEAAVAEEIKALCARFPIYDAPM